MKVGILTYHRSVNYGAVMQSYALAQRLKEIDGVEVEIIDYMSARMHRYYKLFTIYRGNNGIFRISDRIAMYSAIQEGINQLPLSEQKLITDDADKFFAFIKNKYDVIVVGSDAVWNYEKRGLPNPYFLIDEKDAHKISYAASCNGIEYQNLCPDKLTILKSAFSQFEYLGVRDELTERVVESALGISRTTHNCDPTFLLDFEKDGLGGDFVQKLEKKLQCKYNWDINKKHIGLMLSNLNGNLAEVLVQHIKKMYGSQYQIVAIYSFCKAADIPYIADLTPFEWSRIFSLFDMTFTKYFHGTLLSILNSTPVISLSAEKEIVGISTKVEDVLSRLNLREFYYPANRASDIDWDSLMATVNNVLTNPPTHKMQAGVEHEKQSADSFFEYIRSMLQR